MTNGSDALWEGNQLQTLCSPTSKGHPAGFKQPKEKGEENTVKHYFFHHILILRFLMHFNVADFPINFIKATCFPFLLVSVPNCIIEIPMYYCLHYILPRKIYIISMEMLIFYADKLMVISNCKNLRVRTCI